MGVAAAEVEPVRMLEADLWPCTKAGYRAPQRRPYQARELSHANPGQIGIVRLDKILINPAGPRVHPGGGMAAWGRPGKHFRANQIPYTSRKVKFRAKLIKIEQNLKTLVMDFLTLVPT